MSDNYRVGEPIPYHAFPDAPWPDDHEPELTPEQLQEARDWRGEQAAQAKRDRLNEI